MKKIVLLATISFICTLSTIAQITRQNQKFEDVYVINDKVAFIKEIDINDITPEKAFEILKGWGLENYGKDPFISSIRYDIKNSSKKEILVRSRIELVLPENTKKVREKMIMRYRIDGFITDNKCVLQITDLSFLHENTKDNRLPKIIRAEEFIINPDINRVDDLQELRINTRKATLYFLNELATDFEKQFGY